jgi:hypothetical protein
MRFFNGAFLGLFPIHFRAVNEGILQRPAFEPPRWIELRPVFGFDSPVFVITKEPHDKFVQLQKSWEMNQQFRREVQEAIE